MDDLALELGVSKKTLYAYFPGKFDLLEAVLADKFAGVETKLKEVTRAQPHDFPATLRELLAGTQRELDEIKPPFVRDMRQKAPQVFQVVERRRAALIQRYSENFSSPGNGQGMVRKDVPAEPYHRDLAGDRSGDHESAEDGGTRDDAEGRFHRDPQDCSSRCAYTKRTESVNASFVRQIDNPKVIGAREFIRS